MSKTTMATGSPHRRLPSTRQSMLRRRSHPWPPPEQSPYTPRPTRCRGPTRSPIHDYLYAPAHGLSVEKTEALATTIRYLVTDGTTSAAAYNDGQLSSCLRPSGPRRRQSTGLVELPGRRPGLQRGTRVRTRRPTCPASTGLGPSTTARSLRHPRPPPPRLPPLPPQPPP